MRATETRRWTREEYYRMAEEGIFKPGERVELIDGEIFTMTPQRSLHATAVHLAGQALAASLGAQFSVRMQAPLALNEDSEPEPDIAVVRGSARDYRDAHPSTAVLVVEVSETSLVHDRERKGRLYARAGISEYWIINLTDRRVDVYRDPAASATAGAESTYNSVRYYTPGQAISPLHAPDARIAIDDLLP